MRYALLSAVLLCLCSVTAAADWLTLRSTYTHDPVTGERVSQYAPIEPPTAPAVTNFRTSGYTHTRSSLNYGQSADNYHRVERWGDPVRPYGEWRFPYRPFSTPYPNWGTPYAGLNVGVGAGFGQQFGRGNGAGYDGRYGPGRGDGDGRPPGPGGPDGKPDKEDFRRDRDFGRQRLGPISPGPASPENPYPAGRGTPYPVAPYYDGYSPVYRD